MKKKKADDERHAPTFVPKEEQPYEVPANWRWGLGKSLFKPMETRKPTQDTFQYIDIDAIDNKRQIIATVKKVPINKSPSRAVRAIHAGDTLFSMVRPYLKNIAFVPAVYENAIASSGFYVCHPRNFVNDRFVYYLMTSPYVVDGLNHFMKGDNSPSIRACDIENFPFPVPPMSEQQRIVDRVERLFAALDAAREKAQAVLAGCETRKSAILHKAFTGELTEKWRMLNRHNVQEWEWQRIGEFAQVNGGKRLPKDKTLTKTKTAHPYLRIADFGDDTIITDDLHYIDDATFHQLSRYVINKNDVYISIVGTIGKCGTVPEELDGANLTENAAKIVTDKTLPRYLAYCLHTSSVQEEIKSRIRSATLGKLSLANIRDILVPVPSMIEQAQVVSLLDCFLKKEKMIVSNVQTVLNQIDTLKKSILARAFRGELGTNDPAEPPALL